MTQTTATCQLTDDGLVLNEHTFVIKNNAGKVIGMASCETKEDAIRMFCYPDDNWLAYELQGYVCERKLDA